MYGLLGKKLGHSFSKSIHEYFTDYDYSLIETNNLHSFLSKKDFKGLNVTIPYKYDVIQYLDELSPEAKEINAVNTIINVGGKLKGYNTDYYGLAKALEYNHISVYNKDVIILGNGSTSRTIQAYCRKNLANNVRILARNPRDNEYNFNSVDNFKTSTIVFNATPVGMFPNNNDDVLIDLNTLSNLVSVVDVIYNPLRSNLLIEAENRGLKTVNGLYMLISQAIASIELFHNIKISSHDVENYYKDLYFDSSNLVFIGMPMSGKSFFSRIVNDLYGKELIDIDHEIVTNSNNTIEYIFETYGEKRFRELEKEEIGKCSKGHNKAISCGGGAILDPDNVRLLKQNGVVIFIDVPLELLKKCNPKKRPLLQDKSNLEKLFNARYSIYRDNADIIVNKTSFNEKATLKELEVKLNEYFST